MDGAVWNIRRIRGNLVLSTNSTQYCYLILIIYNLAMVSSSVHGLNIQEHYEVLQNAMLHFFIPKTS